MFQRLHDAQQRMIQVTIDGRPVTARAGDSVAAALMVEGVQATRVSAVSGAPRAAYCMMGVCFECLVTIDGTGNRQGCLVQVSEGMAIETQRARREAGK